MSCHMEREQFLTSVSYYMVSETQRVPQGPQPHATLFHVDNTNAIFIATNPIFHERTKCIEVDCHFIHQTNCCIVPLHINLSGSVETDSKRKWDVGPTMKQTWII